MKTKLCGINIQYPISRLILDGQKVIETRTYPIPREYINKDLFIIETPGKSGKFKARIIGIVNFGESFQYKNKREFYNDKDRHHVTAKSIWKWDENKGKWGWPVRAVKIISPPIVAPVQKGIKFTRDIAIDI